MSLYWKIIKKSYNSFFIMKWLIIFFHFFIIFIPNFLINFIFKRKIPRGMSIWYDFIDWLGGYPFETSTPKNIFNFFDKKNFILKKINTVGGNSGCNEFVFKKI